MKPRLFLVVFIGIIVSYSIYDIVTSMKESNKDIKDLNAKYPLLTRTDSISGKVISAKNFKGTTLLSLNNNLNVSLEWSINYNYESFELCRFLYPDDSIYKPSDSDTLYIYCKSQKFYFILGKVIGEKYKKRFYRTPPYRK